VSERTELTSRALKGLTEGVAAVPGDADHPGYEELEAFVDGRLGAVEREIVESHVAICSQCAEDLSDLRATSDALKVVAPIRSGRWKVPAIAAAAAVFLAIWWTRAPEAPAVPSQVAVATPEAVAPAPAATPPDPLSAEDRSLIERVTTSGRLEIPDAIVALKGTPGTLLGTGPGTALVPISPVGTAVVDARPSFSWHQVKGAQAYSVAVYDDRFKLLARSPRLTATRWIATDDLPRNRALTWQVTAHLNGSDVVGPAPPRPEARFQVVEEATANSIATLRERLASQPLELAILLARAGLLPEAAAQLRRAEADPGTAAAAKTLRTNLER
jgi:hypothetical protein